MKDHKGNFWRMIKKSSASLLCCLMLVPSLFFDIWAADGYPVKHVNTGVSAYDIVEIAKSQIGYTEGENNLNKYGKYFDAPNSYWCAYFITWCARQAGIGEDVIKKSGWSTADDLGVRYVGRDAKRTNTITYKPLPGDIIVYDWASDGFCSKSPASFYGDHAGIVEYCDGKYVYTIEGNYSDMVKRRKVLLTSEDIKGYGIPSYNEKHTHYYVSETVTKKATCTADGSKECLCYCQQKVKVKLPATGHKIVTEPAVKATCSSDGLTAKKTCSVCKQVLQKQEVIPATGHTDADADGYCDTCGGHITHTETTLVGASKATCATEGYTGDTVCTECGEVLDKGKPIDRLPHTYTEDWVITIEPTVKTDGMKMRTCAVCHEMEIMRIDRLGLSVISEMNVTVESDCFLYTGKEIKPKVTVKAEDTTLKEGKDYVLSYANNCKVGTASVTVTAAPGSEYTGSKKLNFRIYAPKRTVVKATMDANGRIITECPMCGVSSSVTTVYKISGVRLSSPTVIYNGKARTPSVIVTDSKGVALKKNVDYKYSYPCTMKNPGEYKIKVTFIGNYSGSKTLTFRINPKATSFTSLTPGKGKATLKWKAVSGITGYEVYYYSTYIGKFVKDGSTKKTSYSFTDLYSGKTYKLKVRTYYKAANGKTYYSAFSSVKTVKAK